MAISPKALTIKFQDEADTFERIIDNQLKEKTLTFNGIVTIAAPQHMEYGHYELLKPKYITAGWKNVKWNDFYDQREGERYITLIFES